MSCFQCNKSLPEYGAILISCDGDFVCSEKCKEEYEKEKTHFFNVIIHDDKLMEKWWNK